MEANEQPPVSAFAQAKSRLLAPRALASIAVALALAAAGTALYWSVSLKPLRAVANKRYQAQMALMRLFDLQIAYHGAHGTYANDLDSLLMTAPDGVQLRQQLQATTDINTLAVIGDANKFRLEANVTDAQRTLVKFRGPRMSSLRQPRPK